MTGIDPARFVTDWIDAWNRRDVDAVLRHFHDDAVFSSPLANRLLGNGVVEGKAALRAYWQRALRSNPDLHFKLEGYSIGVDLLVIQFRDQNGLARAEVLIFDKGLVGKGYGTFPGAQAADCASSASPR